VRNRYLDLLRAAAIVRVIVYHLFGWPWLSILLPAMGIMFALAGSLTAASLDRRAPGKVILSRLRRLLPPLWLLGAIAVPAMLLLGWTYGNGGDAPFSWKLGLWILPIGDPPGSDQGIDVWEPLWYIRAYLWFVVLSPLMYAAYKKTGWAAVAAPIVLIAVLDKTGFALPLGRADTAMWDFATYGACWMAGFAHHDGRLKRVKPAVVLGAVAVMGAAALYWLRGHPGEEGYDLNDVSESQALWSLAFVLLALRWQPPMQWLERIRPLDQAVNLLNARAVTVYLWHNIAIAAIWPVLTFLALDDLGVLDKPVDLVTALGLTVLAVLAFGWVEDLAARRKPRLWPTTGPALAGIGGPDGPGGPPPSPVAAAVDGPPVAAARAASAGPPNRPDPAERVAPLPDGKVAFGFARGGRSFENPGTGRTVPPSGPEVAFVPGHGGRIHPVRASPGTPPTGTDAQPGPGSGVPRQSTAARTGDAGGGPGPDDESATAVSWFGPDSKPDS
jgi:acyltransferase-like protein